jgi:hydroxymethylpyrimidine pyrophosphatase-like HAD family hydrolase
MDANAIKLVAIDLDGTLLDPDERISERDRRALAWVRAGGAEVVLVTARGFHRARPFAQELGLSLPVLCCGGALVADSTTGNTLVHRPLLPEHALPIMHFALDHALLILVHHDGHYLAHPATIAAYPEVAALICRPGAPAPTSMRWFARAARSCGRSARRV